MKLLITGCFGFIGFNFTTSLLEGSEFEIIGIDSLESSCSIKNSQILTENKNFTFINEPINNINELNLNSVDAVINFAAETHVDNSIFRPEKFVSSNVSGFVEVLKFCHLNDVNKIIHISTDEVYGSNEDNYSIESDNFNPSSPYSASKAAAELMAISYMKTYGLKITIARPANNFGIFQQPEKLIPYSIANLLNNKNIELYGDGKNIRHWLHVDDTTSAIKLLLEQPPESEIYNIGSGFYLNNLEVSQKIVSELSLSDSRITFVKDRPAHDFRYAVNFEKLKNLGWSPKADFDIEMSKIVHWYKENIDWWQNEYESILINRSKRLDLT